jgi:hypothetical protein
MTSAATIIGWREKYAQTYRIPNEALRDFGDDIAHAMKGLIESGKSPKAAYDIIINGLYDRERAVAANRRRKRTSRKNKRGSRRHKRTTRRKRTSR